MGFKESRDAYRRINIKEYKEGYIPGHKLFEKATNYLEGKEELKPAEVGAIAYRMERGANSSNVLLAAKLYDSLGKKRKVHKLLGRLEVAFNQGQYLEHQKVHFRREIDELHRRNPGFFGNLERRTMVFALSIIAGLALSFSSLSTTGNAVSNLTGTSQGLFGILLFIVGLTGMFFRLR